MRAARAIAGIVLLILGVLLAVAAAGPYLSLAEATSSFTLPIVLMAVAFVVAGAGVVLLNSSRLTGAEEGGAVASSVEDPHHRPPIRSPVLPVTSGGNAYAGLAGGVTVSEDDEDGHHPDEAG